VLSNYKSLKSKSIQTATKLRRVSKRVATAGI